MGKNVIWTLIALFFVAIAAEGAWENHGPEAGSIEGLAVDPSNPNVVYAATQGGVYKSTDKGGTWIQKNNGLILSRFIKSIAIANSSTIYVGHYGGVSKSTNAGDTWVDQGSSPGFVFALAVESANVVYAGSQSQGMYKTTNGGSSWDQINNGIPAQHQNVLSLTRSGSTVLAGTGLKLFRSTNSGGSWNDVSGNGLNDPTPPGTSSTGVYALSFDPSNPAVVYAGTTWGLAKSNNSGLNWSSVDIGLTFKLVDEVAVDPLSSNSIFIGVTTFGIRRSTNGGNTWNPENTGLSDLDVLAIAIINDAGDTDTMLCGLYGGGISKSVNSGNNWADSHAGIKAFVLNTLITDPNNAATVYAGSWGGLHKSTDSGVTWAAKNSGFASGPVIFGIGVDPDFSNILYAGAQDGLYRSTDFGESWAKTVNCLDVDGHGAQFRVILVDDATSVIYGAGPRGVYKSNNNGDNCVAINNGINNTNIRGLAMDPASPNTLYAGSDGGGMFKTTNGNNWNPINSGITNQNIRALVMDPTNANVLYAGTGNLGKVFKTTDGEHWSSTTQHSPPSDIFALTIDPATSTVYAGLDGGPFGVIKLTNGVGSWTPVNAAGLTQTEVFALSFSPGQNYFLHAGTLGNSVFNYSVACPAFDFEPDILPDATPFTAYSQGITVSPVAATYSVVSGSLPSGFTLASNGTLSGFPISSGTFNFTVLASDGECSDTMDYTLDVTGTPPTILLSDNFNDSVQSWTVMKGANWQETTGSLRAFSAGVTSLIAAPLPWSPSAATGCTNCTLDMTLQTTGGTFTKTLIQFWYISGSNRVDLIMNEAKDKWILKQRSGGVLVRKGSVKLPIAPNVPYHVQLTHINGTFYFFLDGVLRITMPAGAQVQPGNLLIKVSKTTTSIDQVEVY